MYAITIDQPGGPEVMKWAQQPDPELPRGHVLVEVAATAVNRADLLQRQGFYPPPPGASDILGLECSGVITELGEDVTVGPSATKSAHCWPAVATPRRLRSRQHNFSRFPLASISVSQRPCRKLRARCGPTS